MNIAFFLTPKSEVVWIPETATMRQALERMEYHGYSAVPILDADGRYVGTLTEGDLLWKLKSDGLSIEKTAKVTLAEVPRRLTNRPVQVDEEMEQLLALAVDQNFVPVVDTRDVFIGIVRRKRIIEYCMELAGVKAALREA
jgi:CBS domain-containing protein